MEREPDSLVDQHLNALCDEAVADQYLAYLYSKAAEEDAIPWNDAVGDLQETFPDEP